MRRNRQRERQLTRDEIIGIYVRASNCRKGEQKNIAVDFNTSNNTVTQIKRGDRHLNITTPYRIAAKVNASLISMACGVAL